MFEDSKDRPEQVVRLQGEQAVNEWLKEQEGTVNINQRDVIMNRANNLQPFYIIWYRQKG